MDFWCFILLREGQMRIFILVLILTLGITTIHGCTSLPEDKVLIKPAAMESAPSRTPATKPGKSKSATQPAHTGLKTETAPAKEVTLSSQEGVIPFPEIKDLKLVAGPQPGTAELLNRQGSVLLLVDALSLKDNNDHSAMLKQLLDMIYGSSSPYVQTGIYPRFRYLLPGVQSSFFVVDMDLTAPQVELLKEALDLFARPEFAPLEPELFDPGIAYVPIDKISNDIAGLTFAGTGVVELNRTDLFGNKYLLASVIAHEASHVLQGPVADNAPCSDSLRREIGNQTIPADFYQWDAVKLLNTVKDGQIGAYHVSLWMLTRLGVMDTAWIVQAIKTGKVGPDSVVNCKL